jgi:hypothetical protein
MTTPRPCSVPTLASRTHHTLLPAGTADVRGKAAGVRQRHDLDQFRACPQEWNLHSGLHRDADLRDTGLIWSVLPPRPTSIRWSPVDTTEAAGSV